MAKQINWKSAGTIIAIVSVLMSFGIFAYNRTLATGEQQKEVLRLRSDLDKHTVDSDKRFEKLDKMAEDIAVIKGYLEATKESKQSNKKNGK